MISWSLEPNALCPMCQVHSDFTQAESTPPMIPLFPVAPPTPQLSVKSAIATSAQLTTVAPILRRSIDAASAARKPILMAKTSSSLPLDYVFAVPRSLYTKQSYLRFHHLAGKLAL
jgi:hypothetical protein